jgi:hypothetical protein
MLRFFGVRQAGCRFFWGGFYSTRAGTDKIPE